MDEGFRGHASHVGAVAANVQSLNHGYMLAKIRKADSDGQPTRTSPNDDSMKAIAIAHS